MTQPNFRVPDPEISRPFKRRLQPLGIQPAFRDGWRVVRRRGEDLWRWARRRPRTLGMAGGAAALTLLGAYSVSASGIGRSACRSAVEGKASSAKGTKGAGFRLLMDPVAGAVTGSDLEIHYDVCGLSSGTAYRGRVQLAQQRTGKKRSARPKPVVVSFQDKADGVATRRHQEVELGKLKPGAYVLELSVVDNRGRERKQVQKIQLKAR